MSSPSSFETNPYTPTSSSFNSDSDSPNNEPTLLDRLLPHLQLSVAGIHANGHNSPLEFLEPTTRRYNSDSLPGSPTSPLANGGRAFSGAFRHPAMRAIPSAEAKDGFAVVQDYDITTERAFEGALASYTIGRALEAFIDAVPDAESMDMSNLLPRFGNFVTSLGTQPMTVDIPTLVDGLVGTWAAARVGWPPGSGFLLLESGPDIFSTLRDYILTREILNFVEDRFPYAEVTFYPSTRALQAPSTLPLVLDFAWSPPTIGFEDLCNVFAESDNFVLKPRADTNLRCITAVHIEYTTEMGSLLPWDEEKGQFEGRCPPALAGSVGAGRLEAFTVPLNMSAVVSKAFPGGMILERTIRLVVPVTIKRRPDTCLGDGILSTSPEVRRPAFSQLLGKETEVCSVSPKREDSSAADSMSKIPMVSTTPVRCYTAAASDSSAKQPDVSSLTPREISNLLSLKAKLGSPGSPLRLDALSLARLWEATAHPHSSPSEVECWTVHLDSPPCITLPPQVSRSVPGETHGATASANVAGDLTSPEKADSAVDGSDTEKRNDLPEKTQGFTDAKVLSDADLQILVERLSRPGSSTQASCNEDDKQPEHSVERIDTPQRRSPVESPNSHFATPRASPHAPAKKPRRDLWSLCNRRFVSRSSKTSEWRVQHWRDVPEKLSEAEKDAVQKAIQESYKTLEEDKENRVGEPEMEDGIDGADSEAELSFEY